MSIPVNRKSSAQLASRREEILAGFRDSGCTATGDVLTYRELKDLLVSGAFTSDERRLYDELMRIESLLNR